jgi:C1A family cysteine protease
MMRRRGLGYRPDAPDNRDHVLFDPDAPRTSINVHRTSSIVASASCRKYTQTIDQGRLGSCTTDGAAQVIRATEVRERVEGGMSLDVAQATTQFMSRLFAYYLARAFSGETAVDSGTQIRNVFRALNLFGFPPEYVWPYSDNTDPSAGPTPFSHMPSANAYRLAFDQRNAVGDRNLVDYARIASTGYERVDDVKRAIMAGYIVEFGTNVSERFCSDMGANNGLPIKPPVGEKIAGGHAMCIVAFDGDDFPVLNSWGLEYGDEGVCIFSADYVAWDESTDFWVARRAPFLPAQGA